MQAVLTIPEDVVTVNHGLYGPVWLEKSGVIITVNAACLEHTLIHALAQMAAFDIIYKGVPRPLIVDMTLVKAMTREARAYYSCEENSKKITALAIVTTSNIGRLIGNFFIGINGSNVPTRIFSTGEAAKIWAMQYVQLNAA